MGIFHTRVCVLYRSVGHERSTNGKIESNAFPELTLLSLLQLFLEFFAWLGLSETPSASHGYQPQYLWQFQRHCPRPRLLFCDPLPAKRLMPPNHWALVPHGP